MLGEGRKHIPVVCNERRKPHTSHYPSRPVTTKNNQQTTQDEEKFEFTLMRMYINGRIQENIRTTKQKKHHRGPSKGVPKRGRTLQTQGHPQKTTSAKRWQFILFLISKLNFFV